MTGPDPAQPVERRSVLIVDDDEDVRGLISMALRRASFVPIEATSGEQALEILTAELPAVVVLDMGMPGMSGLDVIRALRLRPETATLPILLMTGSGDSDTVLHALAAGADDFLAKPVRIDELIARLGAHIRTQAAWSRQVENELHRRVDVAGAVGRLSLPADPFEAAATLAREIGVGAGLAFVALVYLASPRRVNVLATYGATGPLDRSETLAARSGRYLTSRIREGPWVEAVDRAEAAPGLPDEWTAGLEFVAGAPIYAGPRVAGSLLIGMISAPGPAPARGAKLLAEVIDYATIVSAAAGPGLAQHGRVADTRKRLQRTLATAAFAPVFQPIVDLVTGHPIGFEALTRFSDGTAPDVRFAEAARNGLGLDFETATFKAALGESERLPDDVFVALNVSPTLALETDRLAQLLAPARRPVVLELTEYSRIEDYDLLRAALWTLGDQVRIAVDDAGAGYASLRHILELRPSFVKLDLSLVRGIEDDPLRQSLVSGLAFFAGRTDFELIAEGIESEVEAAMLRELRIPFGQGFLFGRPGPIA